MFLFFALFRYCKLYLFYVWFFFYSLLIRLFLSGLIFSNHLYNFKLKCKYICGTLFVLLFGVLAFPFSFSCFF